MSGWVFPEFLTKVAKDPSAQVHQPLFNSFALGPWDQQNDQGKTKRSDPESIRFELNIPLSRLSGCLHFNYSPTEAMQILMSSWSATHQKLANPPGRLLATTTVNRVSLPQSHEKNALPPWNRSTFGTRSLKENWSKPRPPETRGNLPSIRGRVT